MPWTTVSMPQPCRQHPAGFFTPHPNPLPEGDGTFAIVCYCCVAFRQSWISPQRRRGHGGSQRDGPIPGTPIPLGIKNQEWVRALRRISKPVLAVPTGFSSYLFALTLTLSRRGRELRIPLGLQFSNSSRNPGIKGNLSFRPAVVGGPPDDG